MKDSRHPRLSQMSQEGERQTNGLGLAKREEKERGEPLDLAAVLGFQCSHGWGYRGWSNDAAGKVGWVLRGARGALWVTTNPFFAHGEYFCPFCCSSCWAAGQGQA